MKKTFLVTLSLTLLQPQALVFAQPAMLNFQVQSLGDDAQVIFVAGNGKKNAGGKEAPKANDDSARKETERKAKEESNRKEHEKRKAKEESDRKENEKRKAKEESDRKENEKRKAKEESDRKENEKRKAKEESARKAAKAKETPVVVPTPAAPAPTTNPDTSKDERKIREGIEELKKKARKKTEERQTGSKAKETTSTPPATAPAPKEQKKGEKKDSRPPKRDGKNKTAEEQETKKKAPPKSKQDGKNASKERTVVVPPAKKEPPVVPPAATPNAPVVTNPTPKKEKHPKGTKNSKETIIVVTPPAKKEVIVILPPKETEAQRAEARRLAKKEAELKKKAADLRMQKDANLRKERELKALRNERARLRQERHRNMRLEEIRRAEERERIEDAQAELALINMLLFQAAEAQRERDAQFAREQALREQEQIERDRQAAEQAEQAQREFEAAERARVKREKFERDRRGWTLRNAPAMNLNSIKLAPTFRIDVLQLMEQASEEVVPHILDADGEAVTAAVNRTVAPTAAMMSKVAALLSALENNRDTTRVDRYQNDEGTIAQSFDVPDYYGFYFDEEFFWLRRSYGLWWYHDAIRNRWCYFSYKRWWHQHSSDIETLYTYEDGLYYRYQPVKGGASLYLENSDPSEVLFYSDDRTRLIKVTGEDRLAVLFDLTQKDDDDNPIYMRDLVANTNGIEFTQATEETPGSISLVVQVGEDQMARSVVDMDGNAFTQQEEENTDEAMETSAAPRKKPALLHLTKFREMPNIDGMKLFDGR